MNVGGFSTEGEKVIGGNLLMVDHVGVTDPLVVFILTD